MDKEVKNLELIEKYLGETISPGELEELETLMKEDQDFRELYNDVGKLVPGIRYSARNSLLNDLQELESTLPEINVEKRPKVIYFKKYVQWVAAACVLAIIGTITYLSFTGPSFENVYADYYKPYPNILQATKRTIYEGSLSVKDMAYTEYDKQQYTASIALFESLNGQDFDSGALFYLGNAYLALGNPQKAMEKFEQLLVNKGEFQIQAKWYLGLCLLKEKQIDRAKVIFREIAEDKNSYSEKSLEIINQLN